jgi:excisionase family DNA binding protein
MDALLLTKKQAASVLGISIRSIEYMLGNGLLEGRRLGRRRLVTRRSVERLARADVLRIAPSKADQAVRPQEPVG